MKAPRLVLALAGAVLLAGCGGGAATGSGVDTNATGGPGNLFASSAPPTKKTVTPKAVAPKPVAPKPVAPKPQPSQKAPEAPAFKVTINGDKSGKPLFDQPQVAVYSGTKVTWTNADSKPRGVQAQNGAFESGPIAPGASYIWIAGAAGMYAYNDSTRPYVNAQIQVSPR
ncbi:MAG: hypothetical protein ABIO67_00135 [Mycobacteriales bacterium]